MTVRAFHLLLAVCLAAIAPAAFAQDTARAEAAKARVQPVLEAALGQAGLHLGAPVLLRVFKQTDELEVWVRDASRFRLFRTYRICDWSGTLGPKAWEGDQQTPEGFYAIGRDSLRAKAQYHLGLDLGYPNAYDRAHGYDGAYLLVHGGCYSVGCFAMGNAAIEEIYALVDAALAAGQPRVDVHAFPFRFDAPPRRDWRKLGWGKFWAELEPAYVEFNRTGLAPTVRVVDGHYVVQAATPVAQKTTPRRVAAASP